MFASEEVAAATSGDDRRQLASAALLIEVAKADASFSDDERDAMLNLLGHTFALDPRSLAELEALAAQRSDEAVSLHEFTRQIVDNSTAEERCELIGLMWQVAFANTSFVGERGYNFDLRQPRWTTTGTAAPAYCVKTTAV